LNSVDHSSANEIKIELMWKEEGIAFSVKDDGIGFSQSKISNVPEAGHFGLLNLKLRAERVGGTVDIISAEGEGTSVVGTIPITRKLSEDIPTNTVRYVLGN
tara:strand:- start:346 stop:651 length:306 start_codon:yes stop_codon:yes gene_type:complete